MQRQIRVLGVSCAVVLVWLVGVAQAQSARKSLSIRESFAGGADLVVVAAIPEVAKEVKLTDEQTALTKKLLAELRQGKQELYQDYADLSRKQKGETHRKYRKLRQEKDKQLAKSVGAEKFERILQLSMQSRGLLSAFDRGVPARKLEISGEQYRELEKMTRELHEEVAAGKDVLDKINEKVAKILSDEQKKKWKEMIGKPASKELLSKI